MMRTFAAIACAAALAACASPPEPPPSVLTPVLSKDASLVPGHLGMTVRQQDGRVVVTRVGIGSSAERAGVEVGDVIVSLNGAPVGRSLEFYRRVLESKPGSYCEIDVLRAGELRRIRVRVDEVDTTQRV